jgi:hypothetical protein
MGEPGGGWPADSGRAWRTGVGLFVALSPWIAGFSDRAALTRSNLVIGLAVALLGAGFAMAYERTHRLTWVCPLLGIWTIVSVWAVRRAEATTPAVWSNVIGGAWCCCSASPPSA